MSRYQQHLHQMVEAHIKQYLPSAQGRYREEDMINNLKVLIAQPVLPRKSLRRPV